MIVTQQRTNILAAFRWKQHMPCCESKNLRFNCAPCVRGLNSLMARFVVHTSANIRMIRIYRGPRKKRGQAALQGSSVRYCRLGKNKRVYVFRFFSPPAPFQPQEGLKVQGCFTAQPPGTDRCPFGKEGISPDLTSTGLGGDWSA